MIYYTLPSGRVVPFIGEEGDELREFTDDEIVTLERMAIIANFEIVECRCRTRSLQTLQNPSTVSSNGSNGQKETP